MERQILPFPFNSFSHMHLEDYSLFGYYQETFPFNFLFSVYVDLFSFLFSSLKLLFLSIIKTVWCWHKDRWVDQWNRIDCPEINLYIYRQLILEDNAKNIQWERIVISTKYCNNWISTHKRMNLESYFTLYT